MSNLINVVSIFGWGFNFDLSDTLFWLYVAQAVVVFIGIIMFFILLARTRRARREQVVVVHEVEEVQTVQEKKEKAEVAVVADTAATTAAEPQPQVIVVNPNPISNSEPVKKEKVERVLTGISLDVGVVQREFAAGEEFSCDGLLVRANYNLEPLSETIIAYSVVDSEVFDRLSNVSEIKVCYVLRPDLSEAGIKFVTVKYADQTAIYTVSVKEPVPVKEEEPVRVEKVVETVIVEKPVVVEKEVIVEKEVAPAPVAVAERRSETILIGEETVEAGKLRYDRSFMARLIQSDDEVKHWYTQIKNKLLSFKKVHGRISWKRETFKCSKDVVAKLAYRGKTLCLFLPLNVADFVDSKYVLEDMSATPAFVDTPAMIRVNNDKHQKQAVELIAMSMEKLGIKDVPHVSIDYYVPYEGVVELINKGLIKREIKTAQDEAIFVRDKVAEVEEIDNDTNTVTEIFVSAKSLDEAEEAAAGKTPEESSEEAVEEPNGKGRKGKASKK